MLKNEQLIYGNTIVVKNYETVTEKIKYVHLGQIWTALRPVVKGAWMRRQQKRNTSFDSYFDKFRSLGKLSVKIMRLLVKTQNR